MLNLGSEQTLTTPDGRQWRLNKMRLRHIMAFRDWIREQEGDLFAVAEKAIQGKLPEAAVLLKEAEAKRDALHSFNLLSIVPPAIGLRYLMSQEGLIRMTRHLLEENHQGVSDNDVEDVAEELAKDLFASLSKSMGEIPNGEGAAASQPPPVKQATTAAMKEVGIDWHPPEWMQEPISAALIDHNGSTGTKSSAASGTAAPISGQSK